MISKVTPPLYGRGNLKKGALLMPLIVLLLFFFKTGIISPIITLKTVRWTHHLNLSICYKIFIHPYDCSCQYPYLILLLWYVVGHYMDVKVFGQIGGWGVKYIRYLRVDVMISRITLHFNSFPCLSMLTPML